MNKEQAIIKMRQGRFKECFDICISEVKDVNFAMSLAKKGFEWHDKDRRIFYNLFTRLMGSTEENKLIAVRVLSNNCQNIPYEKLTKNFADDDDLTPDLTHLYTKVVTQMESHIRQGLLMKSITEFEKHNLELEKFEFLNDFLEIHEDETLCGFCSKPIGISGFQFDPNA